MDDHVLKQLTDQSPDSVIFAGPDGLISYWNEASARIFGHSAEDAIGKSLDIIIPEPYREPHWRGFNKAIAVGDTEKHGKALPTKAIRADGATIYVELSFAVVKDTDGTVLGASAFGRDITERWAADRETRRQLRELQQKAG